MLQLLAFLTAAFALLIRTTAAAVTGTSNINLAVNTGGLNHYGSGILLGIPENDTQIPNRYFADIGIWNVRSGGSQLGSPKRGWTYGVTEFNNRYKSLLADWTVCKRQSRCNFQVMIHDMWGIDGYSSQAATPMPGDNGNYTSYDNFIDALLFNMKRDGMTGSNVYLDIWNEVDNSNYATRGLDRWIEYWNHAVKKIRRDYGDLVKITGPSYGHLPDQPYVSSYSDWYSKWAASTKLQNTFPDKLSLHFLNQNGDLGSSINAFNAFLRGAGYPNYNDTWNVQEYTPSYTLFPSVAAWHLAQLERFNAWGLRSNWEYGTRLHDLMANLIAKPSAKNGATSNYAAADYYYARDYPVYLYYYKEMQGHRVQTTMTNDTYGDSYATVDTTQRKVRILAGTRVQTGTWYLKVNQLSSLGLPASGSLNVNITRFNCAPTLYDQVSAPTHLGVTKYNYGGDSAIIAVLQNSPNITWAFDFSY